MDQDLYSQRLRRSTTSVGLSRGRVDALYGCWDLDFLLMPISLDFAISDARHHVQLIKVTKKGVRGWGYDLLLPDLY